MKGQLTVLLPQPEVEDVALQGELYMSSSGDGVLLDGTHEKGVFTLEPDLAAKQRILAGHARLFARWFADSPRDGSASSMECVRRTTIVGDHITRRTVAAIRVGETSNWRTRLRISVRGDHRTTRLHINSGPGW